MFERRNATSRGGTSGKRAFGRVSCVLRAFVLFVGYLLNRRVMAADMAAFIVSSPA